MEELSHEEEHTVVLTDENGRPIEEEENIDVVDEEMEEEGREKMLSTDPLGLNTDLEQVKMAQKGTSVKRSVTDRDHLIARLAAVEEALRDMTSLKDKRELERNELAAEVEKLTKEAFMHEKSENNMTQRLDLLRRGALSPAKRSLLHPRATTSLPPVRNAWNGTKEISGEELEMELNRGLDGHVAGMSGDRNDTVLSGNGNTQSGLELCSPVKFDLAQLPQLSKFNGERDKWDVFYDGFLLRYEGMGHYAKQILSEMLAGRALIEYKGLPLEYKQPSKTVRECLSWLKDKCFGGSLYGLKSGGRGVSDVCQELEYLLTKQHPNDLVKREEEKQLTFVRLYEHSREYLTLLKMLDKRESYEEMKKHMLVVEYTERRERNRVNHGGNQGNHGGTRAGPRYPNERIRSIGGGGGHGGTCFQCRGAGHAQSNCASNGNKAFADTRCHNCQGIGHTSRVCISLSNSNTVRGRPGGIRMMAIMCNEIDAVVEGHERDDPNRIQAVNVSGEAESLKGPHACDSPIKEMEKENTVLEDTVLKGSHHPEDVQDTSQNESEEEDPLFYRKFQPVHGTIGGLQVQACLDTGADANLIDKKTFDMMSGVELKPRIRFNIRDAQNKPVKTIGTIVVDVDMNVGRRCKVGFVVTEGDISDILLGNSALDAMGLELRMKNVDEKMISNSEMEEQPGDNAVVLRSVSVAPGQLGTVIVGGGRAGVGSKVLIIERADVVEGANYGDKIVRVPVWNNTNSDLVFEVHDVIGHWCRVHGVNESSSHEAELKQGQLLRVNQCSKRRVDWNQIKLNLENSRKGKLSQRIESIIKDRLRESERMLSVVDTEALAVYESVMKWRHMVTGTRTIRNENKEEDEKVKYWIDAQSKDEWVVSMIKKLKEVERKKRDVSEEVTIPSSTKRTSLADWVIHNGILYLLGHDHEKRMYIPEGRREQFVRDIHDSPFSGHLCTKKMVQKIGYEAFWGNMHKDVYEVLKKCERCLLANAQKRMIPLLQPLVSNFPMEVKTRSEVSKKLENERRRMKVTYDEEHKNNAKIVPRRGDRVYIKIEPKVGDIKKMMARYEGPYRVISTTATSATVVRADDGLETGRDADKRVVQWDRLRLVPRDTKKDEGDDNLKVNMVGCDKGKKQRLLSRIAVERGTPLHPDFECNPCGRRELRTLWRGEEKIGPFYSSRFGTMREAAALLDMLTEGGKYSEWETRQELKRRVETKEVSSKSLKFAYRKGMCRHLADAADGVAKTGVIFEEENGCVSDAVTQVVAAGSGRSSRKAIVALIPSDSPVWDRSDVEEKSEKDTEFIKYSDELELIKLMKTWELAENFPKSVFLMMKSSFADKVVDDIRANCEEIVKKLDVTVYVAGDVLPVKKNDLKNEAGAMQQAKMTLWRLDGPKTNLVVCSSVSGMLNKHIPFVTLFVVARTQSRALLEKAIKHITDGENLMLDVEERKRIIATPKRTLLDKSEEPTTQNRSFPKKRSTISCYNCKKEGHITRYYPFKETVPDEDIPLDYCKIFILRLNYHIYAVNPLTEMDELGLYDDEGQLIAPQPVSAEDENMLLGDLEGDLMQERNDEVAELLNGARHGVEVRERVTRSKMRKIENSKEPRDAIKRIRMKFDSARQNLKGREESKGSTAEAIIEFEGIFDKERKLIEDDLLLLDGVLVANSTDQSNVEKWKSRFQECNEKLIAMSDEIEKAKNGSVEADKTSTVFDTLAELRSNYEALLEEKKNRETRDTTILATVGVESMEEVIDRATKGERRNYAAETSTKVLEQITSALDEVGHSNIATMVDEIFKLREVNEKQPDVLDEIMGSMDVTDMNDIMVSIQISKQQLEEKIKRLETELRREKDLVKKRTHERDQANGEIERTKQAINEKERKIDATIARQREARAALSAAFRGYNLNEARRQRAEQDTDTLRLGNVGAQIVLKEMLSGRALTEYASIPDEYRSKPVRDFLEWLKEKCFGNSMFVEMDLEKKWRAMTVGGRKVDTVCNDIEYIVSKLHTDEHKQEDAKRVQFLLMYENNREYPELLKMMDEKKSYAEMKEHMRRAEYIERTLNQSRLENRGTSNSGRVISGKRYQLNNGTNGRVDSKTCFNCQGIGHLGRECPSKKDLSGRFVNARCGGSGGEGHTSRMCYPDPAAKRLSNRAPEMHNGTLRDAQVSPQNGGSQINNNSNANHTPVIQLATGVGSGLGGSGRMNDNGQRRYGNGSRFNSGNNSNPRVQMITMNEANKGGRENRVSFNRRKPAYVRSENETRKESENGVDETPLMVQASRTGDVINEDPLFVKRFRPVQGVIGGLQVEACLDTGAEVNLIDKKRVDLMNGVDIERKINFDICEALGKSVKTIGTVVVDVDMNVGRRCRVGFVVSESDIPTVLLGNGALEAMGLELNLKKEVLELGDASLSCQPDSAIVLKDVRIEPGRIGSVFVGGGRPGQGSKVLITDRIEVVEGINDGSEAVQVPVWNDTSSDLVFKKNDTIGVWCKVEDVNAVRKGEESNLQTMIKHLRVNGCLMSKQESEWKQIQENLEACRGGTKLSDRVQEIIREYADVFALRDDDLGRMHNMECDIRVDPNRRIGGVISQKGDDNVERAIAFFSRGLRPSEKTMSVVDTEALAVETVQRQRDEERKRDNQIDPEEKENLKQWKLDQNRDEWVVKMLSMLDEVAKNKRDIEEEVVVPGTTKRTSLADWVVHNGLLYLLGQDHEKKLYIPEGRREQFVKEIHNSPLSGHLCTKKMIQKLSQEVFWGSMQKDVESVLRRCERCLKANSQKRMIPPLQPLIAHRFQIERRRTLPYHSRANGLTERFNRTIVEIMRRIKMRDEEWEEALPFAVYAYKASPHGATGETPAYLMYLRDETLPMSQVPSTDPRYTVDVDVTDYKRRLSWMMERTRSIVALKLENERRKMKELYDAKNQHNMKIRPEKGDRVYIKVEAKQGDLKKMMSNYEGPYRVIRTSNTTVTVVRADNGLENGRENDERVVQWDRVRLVPRDTNDMDNVKNVKHVNRVGVNSDFRVAISMRSRLHPDYECMEDDCGGGRRLEDMFPKERMKMERAGKVVFKSLRPRRPTPPNRIVNMTTDLHPKPNEDQ
ncbi:hypothetical protein PRIPAC_94161, partial [Pristionchus pacificus]|uniref:RNA-directed DNA polymerase n=1 Tax=Pristionchus pacificus TaxID=54126 RepID=A0A2A6CDB1_PRIPA